MAEVDVPQVVEIPETGESLTLEDCERYFLGNGVDTDEAKKEAANVMRSAAKDEDYARSVAVTISRYVKAQGGQKKAAEPEEGEQRVRTYVSVGLEWPEDSFGIPLKREEAANLLWSNIDRGIPMEYGDPIWEKYSNEISAYGDDDLEAFLSLGVKEIIRKRHEDTQLVLLGHVERPVLFAGGLVDDPCVNCSYLAEHASSESREEPQAPYPTIAYVFIDALIMANIVGGHISGEVEGIEDDDEEDEDEVEVSLTS